MKSNFISKLKDRTGSYTGQGTNHEGQLFTGTLTLSSMLGGAGISLKFKATGKDGTVFHEECTTIAPDLAGEVGLYNLNTNMPGLVHHTLSKEDSSQVGVEKAVFSFGVKTNAQSFREEITIELNRDGSVGYKYAWGMPGGEFADRSGVVMNRV